MAKKVRLILETWSQCSPDNSRKIHKTILIKDTKLAEQFIGGWEAIGSQIEERPQPLKGV